MHSRLQLLLVAGWLYDRRGSSIESKSRHVHLLALSPCDTPGFSHNHIAQFITIAGGELKEFRGCPDEHKRRCAVLMFQVPTAGAYRGERRHTVQGASCFPRCCDEAAHPS